MSILKRFVWFSEWLLPYAVMFLIATTILLPKLPVFDVKNTFVKIRWDDFINTVVVGVWVCGLSWLRKDFFKSTINRTVIFYLIVGLVSALSAIVITQVVFQNLTLLHWLRRIEYMLFFFVGVSATPNVKSAIKYVLTAFISGFLAIIYGLGQVYFQWCSISTTNREFAKGECIPLTKDARPNSTFAGQYDFAIYISFMIPIILGMVFTIKKYWNKLLLIGLFAIAFFTLIISQARWPVFAAGIMVIVFLWTAGKKLLLASFILSGILLGIGALVFDIGPARSLTTRYVTTLQVLQSRHAAPKPTPIDIDKLIQETTSQGTRTTRSDAAIPGDENLPDETTYNKLHKIAGPIKPDPALEANLSTNIRFNEEWPQAIRGFLRNPLLGSGYASLGVLYDNQLGFATDNDYLRMLGETGLLGTLAFLLILAALGKLVWQYLKHHKAMTPTKGMVVGLSAALLSFSINAIFIDVFESSKLAIIFWLFAGILVGMIRVEVKETNT